MAAEVLFPDADVLGTGRVASSPFGSGLGNPTGCDPELVFAGARAHNRWLADFCAKEPHRRIGVAVVPIVVDVDAAVTEIHEVADRGLRGVMIPTRWFDSPAYHEPVYEPVWAAVAERGLVLHTHSGAGPADYEIGPGFMAIYATEAYWWAARPLWVLLWAGVFERHPDLRYVIAENGAWWVPDLVTKMDEKYLGGHNTREDGRRLPRADLDEAQRVHRPQLLLRRLDARASRTSAGATRSASATCCGATTSRTPRAPSPTPASWSGAASRTCPTTSAEPSSATTPSSLYGIDTAALAPLVERIGPLVEDIHGDTPLQEVPEDRD